MGEFIFDLITARGWSIRHLGELTGISYSGIRDYLRGLPQRLSSKRLGQVLALLDLDDQGRLKPHTLYTWQVEVQEKRLEALNKVLLATIRQHSKPVTPEASKPSSTTDASGLSVTTDASGAATTSETSAPDQLFAATPLFGGETEGLPAPYWLFCWQDIYLLIHWRLPPTRQVAKVPDFYSQHDAHLHDLPPPINPDIKTLTAACWASGMELSLEKARGIYLTPAQLSQLKKSETAEPLQLTTLKVWLQAKPFEDPFWAAMHSAPDKQAEDAFSTGDFSDGNDSSGSIQQQEQRSWTWDMVLQRLRQHYKRPEIAAKELGLK